jgi:hypothetical protein
MQPQHVQMRRMLLHSHAVHDVPPPRKVKNVLNRNSSHQNLNPWLHSGDVVQEPPSKLMRWA